MVSVARNGREYLRRLMIGSAIIALCIVAAVIGLLWLLPALVLNSPRFLKVAKGFDCAGSAVFGGDGKTTISRRAGMAARRGERWGCVLCRVLDRVDPDHCERSVNSHWG